MAAITDTVDDLKYAWLKARVVGAKVTDTVDDLELAYYNKPVGTTLADARRIAWSATLMETNADAEFRFMKAAVGTNILQTLDDLRKLYYAGP